MFEPVHLFLQCTRAIRKLEPCKDGPYKVEKTEGQLHQRVTIRRLANWHWYTVHEWKLVPYLGDPALVSADVPVIDGACSPEFSGDDEGGPKRAKAAPKRKRGRPRKQPQQ